MKTAADLQNLINEIDELTANGCYNGDKALKNKAARNRRFYYKVMLYLETVPREFFLKKQLDKTVEYIRVTTERGTPELLKKIYPELNYRKARAQWRRDNNVPHWQNQIKVIQFIIN